MKLRNLVFITTLLSSSCQNEKKDSVEHSNPKVHQSISSLNGCEVLDGKVYTYLPAAGKDLHLFTLKFDCSNDSLMGLILAPLPEGDHGLAFYKSELRDLTLDDSSNISFLVIPGKLYETQITLDNYKDGLQDFGIDRGEQFFKGKFISDTVIVLNCISEFFDCYTNEDMVFKLKK